MAPIAFLLGGVSGAFSAFLGWLMFGVGFWGAVQVYFIVGVAVAALLIGLSLCRPRSAARPAESGKLQRA